MKLLDVKKNADLEAYIRTRDQNLIKTASTDSNAEGFKWAIWNIKDLDDAKKASILSRYPSVRDEPHLFYYKEVEKDKEPFTLGIVIPVSSIVKVEVNRMDSTIHFRSNTLYLKYDRKNGRAIRLPLGAFEGFTDTDIRAEIENPTMMDSASPNHPKTY